MYVRMYICMCVCIYGWMDRLMNLYTLFTYAVYTCMHVCMYVLFLFLFNDIFIFVVIVYVVYDYFYKSLTHNRIIQKEMKRIAPIGGVVI